MADYEPMNESPALSTLPTCRHALSGGCERRAAALLRAGPLLAPAHLSREAVHRRGWGRRYAALAAGRVTDTARRARRGQDPRADGQPREAVDGRVGAHCAAATSPERAYYHHASRHSGGVPVVAGWSDQWINHLSLRRDSGTAPLDGPRVARSAAVITTATLQIKALLPGRDCGSGDWNNARKDWNNARKERIACYG